MTLYGPDISSYQSGLQLSKLAYASYVIAKTTEGTYYTDKDYQGWRAQARALNKPFLWYHFLSGEGAAIQAAHTKANVGDLSLPGMLDAEPAGSYNPTLDQILAYIDAAHAAGLNLRLCYLPHWYWEQMGSPDLGGLLLRGVHLVSSAYPGGTGTPTQIYPGDRAPGWASYGGVPVEIYQFTDKATDGGQPLDYNAYLGDLNAFHGLLYGSSDPSTGGTDMTYTVGIGWQNDYPDAAAELQAHAPVGTQMDAEHAASYAAMRGIVTAYRAGQAEQKIDAVNAKVDHVLATLADPTALGAAIAAHIQAGGGTDPAALTQAIASHLRVTLATQ